MAKLTHQQKVKLAKKLRTPADQGQGLQSYGWRLRKWRIANKVARQQAQAQMYAAARKEAKKAVQ